MDIVDFLNPMPDTPRINTEFRTSEIKKFK